MEEKLLKDMGGAYTMTDEELEESFNAHDIDNSSDITKDEIINIRKMKSAFYKTMKLTPAMEAVFKEDMDLGLALPNEV
jgi:Ca2+-binding EF-hand superfamily protein